MSFVPALQVTLELEIVTPPAPGIGPESRVLHGPEMQTLAWPLCPLSECSHFSSLLPPLALRQEEVNL